MRRVAGSYSQVPNTRPGATLTDLVKTPQFINFSKLKCQKPMSVMSGRSFFVLCFL